MSILCIVVTTIRIIWIAATKTVISKQSTEMLVIERAIWLAMLHPWTRTHKTRVESSFLIGPESEFYIFPKTRSMANFFVGQKNRITSVSWKGGKHSKPTLPVHTGLTLPVHTGLTLPVHTGLTLPVHTGLTLPVHTGLTLPVHTGLPSPHWFNITSPHWLQHYQSTLV